jgi:hypothetical protein
MVGGPPAANAQLRDGQRVRVDADDGVSRIP